MMELFSIWLLPQAAVMVTVNLEELMDTGAGGGAARSLACELGARMMHAMEGVR